MADVLAQSASHPRAARKRAPQHWFSDLSLSWRGIYDRRTGRTITARELTPTELAKFLSYFAVVIVQGAMVRTRPGRKLRVWFMPERPPPWYIVWSAMTLSGCRFARSRAEADVAFYFEDKTIASTAAPLSAFNGACGDISKSHVARVFEEVAGYPLALDPEFHFGFAVEKSEENGVHDGRLVGCPTPALAGRAYQRFVDTTENESAVDLRTTIIDRKPQFVLVKTKPCAQRFSIHNKRVQYRALSEIYSEAEIALLTRFAEAMQLDWAALDVLRDHTTGRIYVVDVNKTDTGPAADLSWADRVKLKRAITQAFSRMVRKAAARGAVIPNDAKRRAGIQGHNMHPQPLESGCVVNDAPE
jgi:hypothetical protein